MNSRDDIRLFINNLEQNFPLSEWRYGELRIWPYIRIWLFFYMIDSLEGKGEHKRKTKKANLNIVSESKWVRTFVRPFNYIFFLNGLKRKRLLFAGSRAHRVNYKNKRWNRFFDSLIDTYNLEDELFQIEYDNFNYNEYPYQDTILSYHKALTGFLRWNALTGKFKKKSQLYLPKYEQLIKILNANALSKDFDLKITAVQLEGLGRMMESQIAFFEKILKRIRPKKLVILCYYSNTTSYSLVAAANKLQVDTIELQHGPMSDSHLAYGSWNKVPVMGFDLIPKTFWCWEDSTKRFIDGWTGDGKNLYTAITAGHPWMNYTGESEEIDDSDFILYTLQPEPLTLDQLLTEYIIDLIKENRYKWYLRLHPRQLEKATSLKSYLRKRGVLEMVEIDQATALDLPSLLNRAKVHITHSSGCVLEASIMGVPSVIINKIGASYYKNLIQSRDAVSLDYQASDFKQKFSEICKGLESAEKNEKRDYSEIVVELLS